MDHGAGNTPAFSKKIGRAEGAIWINNDKNGPFYKATFKWKDSSRFARAGCRNLLLVAAAITAWMKENPLENADSGSDK